MDWVERPIVSLGVALLTIVLVLMLLVGISAIVLWFLRERQKYAYHRLPINWGEPLIQERSLPDVVVDQNVAEIQNEYLNITHERDRLKSTVEELAKRLERSERNRKRALTRVNVLGERLREAERSPDLPQLQEGNSGDRRGVVRA